MKFTTGKFWSERRLTRLGAAVLIALVLSVTTTLLTDTDDSSMLRRGDFPGFYVLGEILERGEEERLYDVQLQRQIQNEFWPSFSGNFYYSAYPPFVALLIEPLAALPPLPAQLLWTSVMLAGFLLALLIIRPYSNALNVIPLAAVAYLLTLSPITAGILAAQNTGLSILLVTVVSWGLRERCARSLFFAGVASALLLYKPQLALPLIVWTVLFGGRVAAIGAVTTGAFVYLLNYVVLGAGWLTTWLNAAGRFSILNIEVNRFEMGSLPSGVSATIGSIIGFDAYLGSVSLLVSAIAFVVCSILLWRFKFRTAEWSWLLGPMLLVVAPQALFYDLGIALVPAVLVGKRLTDRKVWLYLALSLGVLVLTLVRQNLPLPTLWLISIAAALIAIGNLREELGSAARD